MKKVIAALLLSMAALSSVQAAEETETLDQSMRKAVVLACSTAPSASMVAQCSDMLNGYFKAIAGKSRLSGLCFALRELNQPIDDSCYEAEDIYKAVTR